MGVVIKHIEYYLPEKNISNDDLQKAHPTWNVLKVGEKSGVFNRHIAGDEETALDLAVKAVEKLFISSSMKRNDIDGIIFCTQSPDYIMPSNSFLIHSKFDFATNVWAIDYNLACSGFVYGLAIARGMIETGMGKNLLLITADTYSKYINKGDRSTSVLFGDGAAATIVSKDDAEGIVDIELASSGNEYESFYIPAGGCRIPKNDKTSALNTDHSGNFRSQEDIHMNGFAVWKFISRTVPVQIRSLLTRNKMEINDFDLCVFHQASKLTLDSLAKALKIDNEKIYMNLDKVGNTVSASIPIALKFAEEEGRLRKGNKILISGFGVGLSWGSLILKY
jgi:3-oxoacyl-[acyl-carrier-protein] synthase-3